MTARRLPANRCANVTGAPVRLSKSAEAPADVGLDNIGPCLRPEREVQAFISEREEPKPRFKRSFVLWTQVRADPQTQEVCTLLSDLEYHAPVRRISLENPGCEVRQTHTFDRRSRDPPRFVQCMSSRRKREESSGKSVHWKREKVLARVLTSDHEKLRKVGC